MLNSIRKDKKRRQFVDRFEIQRLQNKVVLQVISSMDDHLFEKYKNKSRIVSRSQKANDKKVLDSKSLESYSFNRRSIQEQVIKSTPRNSSKSRVQNRCIESGRSRAVIRFCKLSRIRLRDKASKGLLPGVIKASW